MHASSAVHFPVSAPFARHMTDKWMDLGVPADHFFQRMEASVPESVN